MIFFRLTNAQRVIYAVVSGALVMLWALLENHNPNLLLGVNLIDVLIGITFGILVMVPFQNRFHPLRSLLLIFSSVVIYASMVRLAVEEYGVLELELQYAIIVSGTLGSLLTGMATKYIIGLKTKKRFFGYLFAAGSFSGVVFAQTIESQSLVINSLGYMVWQALVCWAMINGRR